MQLNTKRLVAILSALASLDLMIGTGQLKVTSHMIPEAFIPAVQDWASFLAVVLTTVVAVITGGSLMSEPVAAPVPKVPAAAGAMLFALFVGAMLAMSGGSAHAQIKSPQQIIADVQAKLQAIPDMQAKLDAIKSGLQAQKSPQQVAGDIDQLVQAVDLVTVADLEDGISIFALAKNYSGSSCFTALRDVVKANAAANDDPSAVPADATAPPVGSVAAKAKDLPIQHAFRAIAKLYNLMVSNQPGGAVRQQCAVMKDDFNNSGPMTQLLSSGPMAKVLPIFKMLGILA